jgi:hypothetical protein
LFLLLSAGPCNWVKFKTLGIQFKIQGTPLDRTEFYLKWLKESAPFVMKTSP